MATRIGINGFGRIGRLVARAALSDTYQDRLDLVAVNGTGDTDTAAHLFKYDSTYGPYAGTVGTDNGNLVFDGKTIRKFQQPDPANIPWSEMDVDIVVECTGVFTDAAKAAAHIDSGGAKKVIISAPARAPTLPSFWASTTRCTRATSIASFPTLPAPPTASRPW